MKKLNKLIVLLMSVMVLTSIMVLPSSAADLSKDGTYTVPVTLYHESKEQVSMGNSYIVQTALITVQNGTRYITVIANGVDNLTFYYYLNGTTEGEKAEATKVSNVVINGTTYSIGYKFPLVTNNSDVGVAFQAPIMPVAPTARLRISYGSAQEVTTASSSTSNSSSSSGSSSSSNSSNTAVANTSNSSSTSTASSSNKDAGTTTSNSKTSNTNSSDTSDSEVVQDGEVNTEEAEVDEEEAAEVVSETTESSRPVSMKPYIAVGAIVIALIFGVAINIRKK